MRSHDVSDCSRDLLGGDDDADACSLLQCCRVGRLCANLGEVLEGAFYLGVALDFSRGNEVDEELAVNQGVGGILAGDVLEEGALRFVAPVFCTGSLDDVDEVLGELGALEGFSAIG